MIVQVNGVSVRTIGTYPGAYLGVDPIGLGAGEFARAARAGRTPGAFVGEGEAKSSGADARRELAAHAKMAPGVTRRYPPNARALDITLAAS